MTVQKTDARDKEGLPPSLSALSEGLQGVLTLRKQMEEAERKIWLLTEETDRHNGELAALRAERQGINQQVISIEKLKPKVEALKWLAHTHRPGPVHRAASKVIGAGRRALWLPLRPFVALGRAVFALRRLRLRLD